MKPNPLDMLLYNALDSIREAVREDDDINGEVKFLHAVGVGGVIKDDKDFWREYNQLDESDPDVLYAVVELVTRFLVKKGHLSQGEVPFEDGDFLAA